MSSMDWRTCKQQEAQVIRGYLMECELFASWIQEVQAQSEAEEQAHAEHQLQEEKERQRYEHARNAGDRATR